MTCTCQRYRLVGPDGEPLEGELVRDPNCAEHGFPTDRWPAGHPLHRHRQWLPDQDRFETPRETEARLYQEMTQ